MGFNTVVMFRNDAADVLRGNPREVAEAVLGAMNCLQDEERGNLMKTMGTRHADYPALYILAGNTLMEVTAETLKDDWIKEAVQDVLRRQGLRLVRDNPRS
ncbi:MAG: hypothetical protein A2939_01660 [Parcubacteria group bacterium RIFCSPLOWO2_01_FULL_48_18]|nr:MAG: hypothetical protein A2939_01660 [Parcubacteria group bacterium RIFCSPLOWO2_01_FULL_48_18]